MTPLVDRFGKPLKIMVLGAGYLGSKLSVFDTMLPDEVGIPAHSGVLIRNAGDAYKVLTSYDVLPDVVINAIGQTGKPNVDWCEKKENQPLVYESNTMVPYWLAQATERLGIKMVHISSGCIYRGAWDQGTAGGQKYILGHSEEDKPNFDGSFYSFSKMAAERLLEPFQHVLTLRIRMPMSGELSDRNLISKLLKYDRIIVEPNSITMVDEFIASIHALLEAGQYGVFNVVSPQPITHERILEIYTEVIGDDRLLHEKIFITPSELETLAPRSNTVLSNDKLSHFITLASTEESVRAALTEYAQLSGELDLKRNTDYDD